MKTVRAAAAASALLSLLVVAGCAGGSAQATAPSTVAAKAAKADGTAVEPATASPAPFGERRATVGGLVVVLSTPKSITPSDTATPHAERAVAFDLLIDNQSSKTYQPTQLAVAATAAGVPAGQVIDSTQGYPGAVTARQEVPPGRSVHLAVAFAAPAQRVDFEVRINPDSAAADLGAIFAGPA